MSEEPITVDELRTVLDLNTPDDWKPHARGVVFLADTGSEKSRLFSAVSKWARDDGFPLRIPHHSVSAAGLAAPLSKTQRHGSELDLAVGGILLLDELDKFDDHGLYNVAKRIVSDKLPVVVVGLENLRYQEDPDAFQRSLGDKAAAMDLEIVTVADLEDAALPPPGDVVSALDAVNLHRRRIGMGPLDAAAAGWTPEDVLLEAERISRLPNPLDVAPGDPVLAEMAGELETALLEQDLSTVDDVLESASDFYGPDARETRALHVLVRSYGVLANPAVARLKRRLMP